MLSQNQFKVINALNKRSGLTQRELSSETGLSLATVNATCKECETAGLIESGRLTIAGIAALKPYAVDNAVILAAGLSSRFAPISYERPKGLLKVRGEILIERQIEQLQAVGIRDIVIVVGYKKESFFYLEDKYGVKIVVNREYASRNNNSSLMLVREILDNTYICSSDNYFEENPFESHVWKAYYSAEYAEGFRLNMICPKPVTSSGKTCTSSISKSSICKSGDMTSRSSTSSTRSMSCEISTPSSSRTLIPKSSTTSLQFSAVISRKFTTSTHSSRDSRTSAAISPPMMANGYIATPA